MPSLRVQRDASPLPAGTAACLGAFDGLHRGHQALFTRARRWSRVAAVTFDPHPAAVLAPARAPRMLQTPTQRERVAAALGLQHLVLLPFDTDRAAQSPQAFVDEVLVGGLRPAAVVVGEDFRFGAGRAGDPELLRARLSAAGIGVEVVEPVPDPRPGAPADKLSSTAIRRALDEGRVDEAAILLGRPHGITGRVVGGARRGRTLGYPTANIGEAESYLPPLGIYATALTVWDRSSPDYGAVWPSVSSLGRNPTFTEDGPCTLEVHVLDLDLQERLYGVEIEVSFVARLRGEERFESVPALVAQMDRDAAAARAALPPEVLATVIHPPREETGP